MLLTSFIHWLESRESVAAIFRNDAQITFNHNQSLDTTYALVSDKNFNSLDIHKNDAVLIDTTIKPVTGDIVVVPRGRGYTFARIKINDSSKQYQPYHPDYGYIANSNLQKVHIWGVVTQIMCNVQKGGDWK